MTEACERHSVCLGRSEESVLDSVRGGPLLGSSKHLLGRPGWTCEGCSTWGSVYPLLPSTSFYPRRAARGHHLTWAWSQECSAHASESPHSPVGQTGHCCSPRTRLRDGLWQPSLLTELLLRTGGSVSPFRATTAA